MATLSLKRETRIVISDKIGDRPTDHKAVKFLAKMKVPKKGPGYWKLNCNLLESDIFYGKMKEHIQKISEDLNASSENKFMKWETLKRMIKEFCINYSVKRAKAKRDELRDLEREQQHLDKDNLTPEELARKEIVNIQINSIYDEKLKGAQIRSKAKYIEEGEKSNKYFKSLESHHQTSNVIDSLKMADGSCSSNHVDIIKQIGEFYEALYLSSDVKKHEIDEYLRNVNLLNKINDHDNEMLGKMPTCHEFECVMKHMKPNKSPGLDGLPAEFYNKFWDDIKDFYLDMIQECWDTKDLPISMKTAILSLIHKGKARDALKNYRPISLMNTDYKLLAFVFAFRLQTVIASIIDPDQSAYVKRRFIGCSIRNLIDIFELCESEGINGALINIDYAKAFDSLEHNFIFSALEKFNFGESFIQWIKIFYNQPLFRVKNNGWISKTYTMKRGIRQGCSLSSLIFIIAVEILATLIRNDPDIKGIKAGQYEHKIVQFADDATIMVGDIDSIDNVLTVIEQFSSYAGPKLNMEKTKGIWLGPLKDLGLRRFCGITWTGNPVKCLGIYIGHKKEKCYHMNWVKRLTQIKNEIKMWKCRKLTLEGRIKLVKVIILSKLVFPATMTDMSDDLLSEIKTIIYNFIWDGRDKVKRNVMSNRIHEGGYNMTNIDCFFDALKASWICRILNQPGKWKTVLLYYLEKLSLPIDYVIHMNFQKTSNFPIMRKIPAFYRNILICFNKAKNIKPLEMQNSSETLSEPLFGNEFFKANDKCLYFPNWIRSGIYLVKHLVSEEGHLLTDEEIYNRIQRKINIISEIFVIKNVVLPRITTCNLYLACGIRDHKEIKILHGNRIFTVLDQNSKFFYEIFKSRLNERNYMEHILSLKFMFPNNVDIWESIYIQKIKNMYVKKLAEFNFKILHNILPCGKNLSKWQKDISKFCDFCKLPETPEHMLFECTRVQDIWSNISTILKMDIRWKNLLCGFIKRDLTPKIEFYNLIFTIVMYAIFRQNSKCKFEKSDYRKWNLKLEVKTYLEHYRSILELTAYGIYSSKILNDIIDALRS